MKHPRSKFFYTLLLIIAFLIGLLSYQNTISLKKNHIAYFTPSDKKIVSLRGIVISPIEESITQYKNKRLSFIIKTLSIKLNDQWLATSGLAKLNIYEPKQNFEYGDELIVNGQIYSPQAPTNVGQFNYKQYLARNGIYTLFNVNKNDQIILVAKNRANFIINFVLKVKNKLNHLIEAYIPQPESVVLQALLLGSRREVPQYLEDKFIQTGTVHILSVSGLHVALLCFILIIFFKAINLPRRLYLTLTMLLILLYCFLTGSQPPIVRSTVMIEIVLFGLLILREPNIYNSLALAALIILIKNPQELFDVGFQLSFISVFSIVYFTPKIEELFNPPLIINKIKTIKINILIRFKKFFIKSFSVSLGAWIGTLILIIYYFNIFSPATVFANLLVVPLVTLIMASGFTFIFFGLLSPILALVFSSAVEVFLRILLISVDFFSNLPFAFRRVPSISIFAVLIYFSLLFLVFNYKRLHLSMGKLLIIFALFLNFLIWPQVLKPDNSNLKITFLDIGHGDSIFVEFPHKGNMLIDGGLGGENDKGKWIISPFLWHKGISKIDALLLTHPHADHVGGLATVINNFKINYIFDNGRSLNSWAYKNYLSNLEKKNIPRQILKSGQEIAGYPEVKMLVFNPPPKFLTNTMADENNNSLVLKIIFKQISFLLCADLEEEGIRQLLLADENLKAEVIKIPHHGSSQKEIGRLFLERANPETAVITVAQHENNLPATETISTLKEMGANIYLTSISGAITITTNGYNYNINTMLNHRKKIKNRL